MLRRLCAGMHVKARTSGLASRSSAARGGDLGRLATGMKKRSRYLGTLALGECESAHNPSPQTKAAWCPIATIRVRALECTTPVCIRGTTLYPVDEI